MVVVFARVSDHVVVLGRTFSDGEVRAWDQNVGGICCTRPFLARGLKGLVRGVFLFLSLIKQAVGGILETGVLARYQSLQWQRAVS